MIKIMGEKTFGGLGGVIPVQTAPNVYMWLICIKDGAHAGTTEAAREAFPGRRRVHIRYARTDRRCLARGAPAATVL